MAFLSIVETFRVTYYPETRGSEIVIVTGERLGRNHAGEDFLKDVKFGPEHTYKDADDFVAQRLDKMLLPISSLVPNVKSVSVLDTKLGQKIGDRLKDSIYPALTHPDIVQTNTMLNLFPQQRAMYAAAAMADVQILENSQPALHDARVYAKRLTGSEHPLVFTLRNNRFDDDRSRDTTLAYKEIAAELAKDHPVLLLPDTGDVPYGLDTKLPVAYEASLDIRMRSALYEVAKCNFIGNNGPVLLMYYNKNVTYYNPDLATGWRFQPMTFEKALDYAGEFLRLSHRDPTGKFQARLEELRRSGNLQSTRNPYQVMEYRPLTLENARAFLDCLERRIPWKVNRSVG